MPDISKLVLEVDSSGVIKATGNLDAFAKKSQESLKSANTLEDVLSKMNLSAIASAGGVYGLYKAFNSLVSAVTSFSKNAVASFSAFEQIENNLQGVLRSAEKGTAMFEDLRKFSFDTTFGVDTLSNAATQLLNVGTSARQVKTILLQLGNVAGGNTQKFNELVDIYAKIQNTGKASANQLQQLALRQVPIYQYLKKIGVEGNATGRDIANAFSEMTKEGEQFYGAMQRINETISGKEGFVSDTFREFLTSFAEASGIADAYKTALDGVYNVLQGIVDWLQTINENPVYQAIFRGVLVGAATSLAVIVGGSLLGALKKVTAELMTQVALRTALSAMSGNFVGLAAAGVAAGAAVGAVVALNGALKDNNVEMKKSKDRIDALIDSTDAYAKALELAAENSNSLNAQYRVERGEASFADKIVYYKDLIRRAEEAKKAGFAVSDVLIEQYKNELKEAEESLRSFTDAIDAQNRAKEENYAIQEAVNEQHREYLDMLEAVNAEYKKSDNGNLEEMLKQIDSLEDYKSLFDAVYQESELGVGVKVDVPQTDEVTRKINKLIKDAEDKAHALKLKIAIDEGDWRAIYEDITGTKSFGTGKSGAELGNDTVESIKANIERQTEMLSKFYGDDTDKFQSQLVGVYKNTADEIRNMIKSLIESNATDEFSFDDNSINALLALSRELESMSERTSDLKFSIDDWITEFKKNAMKSGDIKGTVAGSVMQSALSASNDASNFVNGFSEGMSTGGPVMGVVAGAANTLIGAFSNVASSVDGMDDVLNPITAIAKQFIPIFELIAGIAKPFFATLEGIQTVGSAIVEGLLRPLEPLITLITESFGKLANLFTKLFDSLDPIIDVINMIVGQILNAIDAILEPLIQGFQMVGNLLEVFTALFEPLNAIINAFSSALRLLAAPIRIVALLFQKLTGIIRKFFEPFIKMLDKFMGWVDWFLGSSDELAEEREKEAERLRRLNDEYANLYDAMKEQEEYYLTKKNELNAGTYKAGVTSVNDMIITPQGKFSTAPDDYIIATKKPQSLGGGGTAIYVTIQNNAGVEVATEESTNYDGSANLLVTISEKIAGDYASGINGWESAFAARQSRMSGRRISI